MMGNRLRLIVWVKYRYRVVYVKWIGTHSEYSKINAEIVGYRMLRPIRNDNDLDEALARIEEIFGAEEGTPEDNELAILLDLVERMRISTTPFLPQRL